MAVETCLQVSTIANTTSPAITRASLLHAQHPFISKEKLNLNTTRSPKKPFHSLSSSSSSSPASLLSAGNGGRRSRFVCEAKNAVDEVVVVSEESWDNVVIGSNTPVIVEFWAPWCGPCRMLEPVIKELAKEYAGKVACCQVNTDECQNIASRYGIRSIPTVLVFKNGERKDCIVGAVPKTTLETTIEKYLQI